MTPAELLESRITHATQIVGLSPRELAAQITGILEHAEGARPPAELLASIAAYVREVAFEITAEAAAAAQREQLEQLARSEAA